MGKKATLPQWFKVSTTLTNTNKFRKLPANSKVLFFHLCKLRYVCLGKNPPLDKKFWHSDVMLISETGLSPNTLRQSRRRLMADGFISCVVGNRGRASEYYVMDDLNGVEKLNHISFIDREL